jgi:cholesterol transport system auxiliary component
VKPFLEFHSKKCPRPGLSVLAAASAFAALLLVGCFLGKSSETKFYLLDYIPSPTKERLDKGFYPYVVRIKDPTINETYRRSQIVYRQSAYQMQFYSYHLWAVDPERMVGDLLSKHLRAAHLFQNVTRSVEEYEPDYVLTTEVQAIEEYDYQDQWFAHLAIEYHLEDGKTGQTIWKKPFDLRHKVSKQEPVYLVRELSALLETTHARLVSDLDIVLDEARYRSLTETKPAATSDSAR